MLEKLKNTLNLDYLQMDTSLFSEHVMALFSILQLEGHRTNSEFKVNCSLHIPVNILYTQNPGERFLSTQPISHEYVYVHKMRRKIK